METKRRYFFGEWVDATEPMTVDQVDKLCDLADERRIQFANYPTDRVLALVGKVRDIWKDPQGEPCRYLRERLPEETGFSPAMIELAIQELVWVLDPSRLKQKLDTELRGIPRNGDFFYQSSTRTCMNWSPIGTVLHILSGNVFLVGAGSLLEGLITGNVTILKMSSGETTFLPKLMETFVAADEDGIVSKSIALVDYSSKQADVIAELKKRVDGIVVWGGEEAVQAYRNDLPARTRILIFGPKLSFAAVTANGFSKYGAKSIADSLAAEITIWDQNACTAPQVCYVEKEENARELVELMGTALSRQALKLPPGEADVHTAVEIQKMRSVFEIAEIRSQGMLRASPHSVNWTVVLDKEQRLEPSPLHRTIRVIPFDKFSEVTQQLEPLRGYVQTVGLSAGGSEGLTLSRALAVAGAQRVVELGQMAGSEIDDPHDGCYNLPSLVNIVVTRLPQALSHLHPLDVLSSEERKRLIDERLRTLVYRAKASPFYGQRLAGVTIESCDDLVKIPRLTRAQMDANMPSKTPGLQTGEFFGGYVSRSGGSTGAPKFSVYDHHDWDQMIQNAVRLLEAAGLVRGDRVANCFLAGDLYGSFVSFDHINFRVGATTFAFTGTVAAEPLLEVWRRFHVNVIEGIPTALMPVLRRAKALEPRFTMEKVIYAGTPLSPSDGLWLKDRLGVRTISSIIGANDGGQLAFQCSELAGPFHHSVDDFNFVEIVNDEGERVPEGEPGRILITSLLKFAFPLIRYEIGDAGRLVKEPCRCGRTSRVIEYLGRADDGLCLGSGNLEYGDFLRAVQGLPVSTMQMVAKNEEAGEYLLFRVETDGATEELKERVMNAIIDNIPGLRKLLSSRAILRLEVECFPPGGLPGEMRGAEKLRTFSTRGSKL